MTVVWTDDPVELHLSVPRFDAALRLIRSWCETDALPAITITVGRPGIALRPQVFGRQHPGRAEPLPDEAIFSVASITKPVVAMGAMRLVECGLLALGDKVVEHLPEFSGKGRHGIRVRHLLTHTSGLPDLLPHDRDLRRAKAPLSRFFDEVCRAELLFAPGRGVSYSSCAFVLLGELIARIAGMPLSQFLRDEMFEPLGMNDSALGAPPEWFEGQSPLVDRFASVRVPAEQAEGDDWNWNSRYWRTLGAPWGGLLSTAADVARFAAAMLDEASFFSPASIAAATTNQLAAMREVPEPDRRARPWGLGWRLNWSSHGAYFGDLLSPRAYGHWGATGTLLWIDPERKSFAVLLSTQPQDPDGPYLARLSNLLAAALLPC
jgi:CubicO group peptidase (beta-lactamase class C family)